MSENFKEKTVCIDGMHCSSCELLIEKKLLKKPGVQSVDVSLKNTSARIVMDENSYLDLNQLNEEFKSLGYSFSKDPISKMPSSFFIKDLFGNTKINPVKLKSLGKNLVLIVGLLFAFVLVEKAQLGRFVSIKPGATLSAFFVLGLVAGLSSCAALIGGLLLSLTKHWHNQTIDSSSGFKRAKPHLLFHVGRLLAFFLLGGILGLIGQTINFSNTTIYALLVIAISIMMFIVALQMLDVAWAQKFSFRMPKSITRSAARDHAVNNIFGPLLAGGLTFFLPCGFTLIAQGVALASGSFIFGALVMLYFAFGTLPVLAGISLSGLKFTSKPHLTARFSTVAGVLILFFALYNINGQLNVLGLPSLSDLFVKNTAGQTATATKQYQAANGEQIISLVAKDFNYIPTGSTNFKAGVPTKLVVDNQGVAGCGSFLAARGLLNGFVSLKPGQNVIDLGKPNPGTYKVTCSMGMVPPVTIVVK